MSHNKEMFDSCKIGVPYLVGEITSFQFIEMKPFGYYMLSIDPEAAKVKLNNSARINAVEMQTIYCTEW